MRKYALLLMFFLMAGGVIFFGLRYRGALSGQARLKDELSGTKKQAGILEEQLRQKEELIHSINEEKRLLSGALKEAEDKISQLGLKNAQSQEQISSLIQELEEARKENDMARQDLAAALEKAKEIKAQRVELDTKLRSLPELKKAMRELKMQMRKRRPAMRIDLKPHKEIFETESNFGYIVRDGIPAAYRPRIKIEVRPAQ